MNMPMAYLSPVEEDILACGAMEVEVVVHSEKQLSPAR